MIHLSRRIQARTSQDVDMNCYYFHTTVAALVVIRNRGQRVAVAVGGLCPSNTELAVKTTDMDSEHGSNCRASGQTGLSEVIVSVFAYLQRPCSYRLLSHYERDPPLT